MAHDTFNFKESLASTSVIKQKEKDINNLNDVLIYTRISISIINPNQNTYTIPAMLVEFDFKA